jgi:hypothetical protein
MKKFANIGDLFSFLNDEQNSLREDSCLAEFYNSVQTINFACCKGKKDKARKTAKENYKNLSLRINEESKVFFKNRFAEGVIFEQDGEEVGRVE